MAAALNKITATSPSRQHPSDLETSIATALYDLESNIPDMKTALRPLQFVSAREVRCSFLSYFAASALIGYGRMIRFVLQVFLELCEFSRLHAYFLGLKIRPMHSEHFSLLRNIFPPHMNVPANTIHHSSKSATAKKQSSFSSPSLSLPVFIKFNNGTSLSLLPSLLSLAIPSSPSQYKLIPTSVIQPNPGAREEVL